jgi:MFS family permease
VPSALSGNGPGALVHRWRSPPVLAVAAVVMAAGFGQFGAVAALADVAEAFGEVTEAREPTIAEQAGLSGTQLGLGLAIIRLASLGSLPLAGLADRVGRRVGLIALCTTGLVLVSATATAPGYWWFVALFALSRPLLTGADAVGVVAAAEQTDDSDRAWAVALVAAAFGVGAGAVAIVRGVAGDLIGFRVLFALAVIPAVLVVVVGRWVTEPERFRVAEARQDRPLPVLGAIGRRHRGRLVPLVAVVFAVSAVTGPANSFLFVYAEGILGLSPAVTAGLVAGAGVSGLIGLLIGRWGADHLGRRPTGAVGLVGVAAAGIVTYSGGSPALVAGYLLAVTAGSVFAPAVGALQAELFPTLVRSSVAGWLVVFGVLGAITGLLAFGAIADAGDRFGLAAAAVFVPAAALAAVFLALPETRGLDLEGNETP